MSAAHLTQWALYASDDYDVTADSTLDQYKYNTDTAPSADSITATPSAQPATNSGCIVPASSNAIMPISVLSSRHPRHLKAEGSSSTQHHADSAATHRQSVFNKGVDDFSSHVGSSKVKPLHKLNVCEYASEAVDDGVAAPAARSLPFSLQPHSTVSDTVKQAKATWQPTRADKEKDRALMRGTAYSPTYDMFSEDDRGKLQVTLCEASQHTRDDTDTHSLSCAVLHTLTGKPALNLQRPSTPPFKVAPLSPRSQMIQRIQSIDQLAMPHKAVVNKTSAPFADVINPPAKRRLLLIDSSDKSAHSGTHHTSSVELTVTPHHQPIIKSSAHMANSRPSWLLKSAANNSDTALVVQRNGRATMHQGDETNIFEDNAVAVGLPRQHTTATLQLHPTTSREASNQPTTHSRDG